MYMIAQDMPSKQLNRDAHRRDKRFFTWAHYLAISDGILRTSPLPKAQLRLY